MREYNDLKVIDITTTKAYKERERMYPRFLKPFWGAVLVICLKTSDKVMPAGSQRVR